MFEWLFYVLAAVLMWALNTTVDKIVLTKHLNPFSYFLLFTPPKLAIVVWAMLSVPIQLNYYFYVSFVAGILGVLGYYTWAFAVQREELSRVYSLANMYPIFVAIFAMFFVNEIFSLQAYVGVALTVLGAVLISYKSGRFGRFVPLIVIFLTLATNISYAAEQTFSKVSLNHQSFWQFLGPYLIGNLLTTLPALAIPNFARGMKQIPKLGKIKLTIIEISCFLWMLGIILFFFAASLGPITLVSTISTITPFVILLFTFILTKFWPKVLAEKIDAKTVGLKVLAIALLVFGIFLIS